MTHFNLLHALVISGSGCLIAAAAAASDNGGGTSHPKVAWALFLIGLIQLFAFAGSL